METERFGAVEVDTEIEKSISKKPKWNWMRIENELIKWIDFFSSVQSLPLLLRTE